MGRLDQVFFSPSNSLTFHQNGKRQTKTMEMISASTTPVVFKLKSTLPGFLKLRPVYGLLVPCVKKTVTITYRGGCLEQGPRHHITIELALAPDSSVDPEDFWKTKSDEVPTRKKVLPIRWVH